MNTRQVFPGVIVACSILFGAPNALADLLSYHEHDGLMIRLSFGAGVMSLHRDTEGPAQMPDFVGASRIQGSAVMGELVAGATPWPGVVLGGALLNHVQGSPVLRVDPETANQLAEELNFTMLGPSLSYYPWPSMGWNLNLVLGRASAEVPASPGSPVEKLGGNGWGMSVAGGHDWWVGDEWSAGLRVRGTLAELGRSTREQDQLFSEQDVVGAIGLMFSLVYH